MHTEISFIYTLFNIVMLEICEEIQNKANDCNVRLEVISERWTELRGASLHTDSVEMAKLLTRQKERINGMMATKNEVIQSLRLNFDRLNNDYELNIYKQVIYKHRKWYSIDLILRAS